MNDGYSNIIVVIAVALIAVLMVGINSDYGFLRKILDKILGLFGKNKEDNRTKKSSEGKKPDKPIKVPVKKVKKNTKEKQEEPAPEPIQETPVQQEYKAPQRKPPHRIPMTPWVLELMQYDQTVKQRIRVPECSQRDVTVGDSSDCTIWINGYKNMCDEHIILRADKKGVFFVASDACTETVIVDGRLAFNPEGIKNEAERRRRLESSKTYLSDGMMIELGEAMLRAVSELSYQYERY